MKFGSRPPRLDESSPLVRSASRKVSGTPASAPPNYLRVSSCTTSVASFSSTPTAKRTATASQERQVEKKKGSSQSYSRNSTPLRKVDHSSASFSIFSSSPYRRGGSLSSNQGRNPVTNPSKSAVLRSSVKKSSAIFPPAVPDALSPYNVFGAVPQRGFFAPCRCAVSVTATAEPVYSRHVPPNNGPNFPFPVLQPLVKSSSTLSVFTADSSPFPTSPLVEKKQNESKELPEQSLRDSEKDEKSSVQVERLRRGTEKFEKPPPLLLSTFMDEERHSISPSSVISSPLLRDLTSRKMRRGSIPPKTASSYAFSSFPPGRGQGDPLFASHTKIKSATAATKVLSTYRGQRYQQALLDCHFDLSECGKSGLHSTLWTASMDGSIEVRSSSSPSMLLRVIEPPPPPPRSKSSTSPVSISCMKQIGQNHVVVGDTSGYLYVYACTTGELVKRIQAHQLAVICMAVVMMPTSSDSSSDSSSASNRSDSIASSNYVWEGGEVAKQAAAHAYRADGREKKKRERVQKPLHLLDSDLCYPRATVLLTGSRDGTIGKWDGVTLECLGRLRCSSKRKGTVAITALCATASGCYAFSGSESGVIRCWSLIENAELKILRSERKAFKKYRKNLQDTNAIPELSSRSLSVRSNQSAESACSSQSSRASTSSILPYPRRKTGIKAKTPSSSCMQPPPLYSTKRESVSSHLAKRSHASRGFDFYFPPSTSPNRREGSKAAGDVKNNAIPMPSRQGKGGEREKSRSMSLTSYSSLGGKSATPGVILRKGASSSSICGRKAGDTRRNSCPPFPLSQAPRQKPTASPHTPRTESHLRSSSLRFSPFSTSSPASNSDVARGGKGGGESGKKTGVTDETASLASRHGAGGNSGFTTPLTRHALHSGGHSLTPLQTARTEKRETAKKSAKNALNGESAVDCVALYHRFKKTLHAFQVQSVSPSSGAASNFHPTGLATSSSEIHEGATTSTTTTSSSPIGSRYSAVSHALHLNDTEEADPFHFSFPLLSAHESDVMCLEMVEDRVLVSCSRDGTANAFSLPSGRHVHRFAALYPRSRSPALTQVYYHSPSSRLYVFTEEGEVAAYNMLSDRLELVVTPMRCAIPYAPSTSTVLKAEGLHRFALFSVGVAHDHPRTPSPFSSLSSSAKDTKDGTSNAAFLSTSGGLSNASPSSSLPSASTSRLHGCISMVGQMDRNPFVPAQLRTRKNPQKKNALETRDRGESTLHASSPPNAMSSSPCRSAFAIPSSQETLLGQCRMEEVEAMEHLHHLQVGYATQRYWMDAVQRAGSVEHWEKMALQQEAHRCRWWRLREMMRRYFLRWLRWKMRRMEGRSLRLHALQALEDSIEKEWCRRYFSRWCRWHHEQARHCFESRLRHVTRRVREGRLDAFGSSSSRMEENRLPTIFPLGTMRGIPHGVLHHHPLSTVNRAITWQLVKVSNVLAQQKNQARRRYAYERWQNAWDTRKKREEAEYHCNRLLLSSFSSLESPAGAVLTFLRNKALKPALWQRIFPVLSHRAALHARPCQQYYFRRWLQFRKDARQRRAGGPDWQPHPALLVFRSPTELRSHYFLQWSNFACHHAPEDRLRREYRMLAQEWLILQQLVSHSPSIDALKMKLLEEETERMRLSDAKEVLEAQRKKGEETYLQLQAQEMLKRFLFGFGAFDVLPTLPSSVCRSAGRNIDDLPLASFPHSENPETVGSFGSTLLESRPCRPFMSPPLASPSRLLGGGEVHHRENLREDMPGNDPTRTGRDEDECRRMFFSMFRALKACVPHFDRDCYRLLSACDAVMHVSQSDTTLVGLLAVAGGGDGGEERENARKGSGKGRPQRSAMSELNEKGTTAVHDGRRRDSTFLARSSSVVVPPSRSPHESTLVAAAEGNEKRHAGNFLWTSGTPSPILDLPYTSITEAFERLCDDLLGTLYEAGRESGIDPNDTSQLLGVTVDADGAPCAFPHEVEGTRSTAMPIEMGGRDLSTPLSMPTSCGVALGVKEKMMDATNRDRDRADLEALVSSSPFLPPVDEEVCLYPSCEGEEGGGPIRIHLSPPFASAEATTRAGRGDAPNRGRAMDEQREARAKEGEGGGGVEQEGGDHRQTLSYPAVSTDRSTFSPSRVPPFLFSSTTALPSTTLPAPPPAPPVPLTSLSSASLSTPSHVRIPWLQLVSSRTRQRVAERLLCLLVLFDCIALKNDHVMFSSCGERVLPWSAVCNVSTAERLVAHAVLLFELFYPPLWNQEKCLETYFSPCTAASVGMTTMGEAEAGERTDASTNGTLGGLSFPVGNSFLSSTSSTPRPLSLGSVTPPLLLQEMLFSSIPAAYMIQTASLPDVDDAAGYHAGWGSHQRSSSTSFSRGTTAASIHPYGNSPGKGLFATTPARSTISAPTTPAKAASQFKIEKITEEGVTSTPHASPVSKLSQELLQQRRRSKLQHDSHDPSLTETEAFLKVSIPAALSPSGGKPGNARTVSRSSPFLLPEEEQELGSSVFRCPPPRFGQMPSFSSFPAPSVMNDGRSITPRSDRSFHSPSFSPARSVSGGGRSVSGLQSPSEAFHCPASLDGEDDRRSLMSLASTTPRGSTVAGNVGGIFQRPFLGFRVQVMRDAGSSASAIVIKDVVPTYMTVSGEEAPGPAAAAGLQSGDQLMRFAHYAVTDLPAFNAVIARHVKPGAQIPVVVLRKNQTISTVLKVAMRLS